MITLEDRDAETVVKVLETWTKDDSENHRFNPFINGPVVQNLILKIESRLLESRKGTVQCQPMPNV